MKQLTEVEHLIAAALTNMSAAVMMSQRSAGCCHTVSSAVQAQDKGLMELDAAVWEEGKCSNVSL